MYIYSYSISVNIRGLSIRRVMESTGGIPTKEMPVGLDAATQEDFSSLSKLLQEFTNISTIDKAWTFKPENGMPAQMFLQIFSFCYYSYALMIILS